MTSFLGFVIFGRGRSKEKGRYFGKFLRKIDEIQKSSILTKPTFESFFRIKQSNRSNV